MFLCTQSQILLLSHLEIVKDVTIVLFKSLRNSKRHN